MTVSHDDSTLNIKHCPIITIIMQCACLCRPDGIGTVLHEERDRFLEIKDRLRRLLEHQLTNFR